MSLLGNLGDLLGSSLFREVKETVMAYFPPELGPEKRLELQMKMEEIETKKLQQISAAMAEAEQAITERATLMEGAAKDLRTIPVIGPLVLFLRGTQRPMWGYATMYADAMWFMGQWQITEQQESALWVINFLVLGFLFGESGVQNAGRLIAGVMNRKKP